MEETKVTSEYIQVLVERSNYFYDKKVTELTTAEIEEYLNLRNEMVEAFPEVKEMVTRVWDVIKEHMEPYLEATKRYQERVLRGDK